MTKISVITPCFNSEATIERTILSVLKQDYENYEYIIVDGSSTDHTLRIVDKYRDAFGDRLKVISEPDDGIYFAMNKGIMAATGDIVGIINSDDYYELDCLSKVAYAYQERINSNSGRRMIIYGAMRFFMPDGRLNAIRFHHHDFLETVMINHPASFVTRNIYTDIALYDTKYASAADMDFMIKMKHESSVEFVPMMNDVLANFTLGGMSSGFTSERETIDIKYKWGVISKKSYLYAKFKLSIRRLIG